MITLKESLLDDEEDLINDKSSVAKMLVAKLNELLNSKRAGTTCKDMFGNVAKPGDILLYPEDKCLKLGIVHDFIISDISCKFYYYTYSFDVHDCDVVYAADAIKVEDFFKMKIFHGKSGKELEKMVTELNKKGANSTNKDIFNRKISVGDIVLCCIAGKITSKSKAGVVTNVNNSKITLDFCDNTNPKEMSYGGFVKLNENDLKKVFKI